MEPAFLRRLSGAHRTFQTTLPTPSARTIHANQSIAARVRVRLPVELQGSESDRRDTKVNIVVSSAVEIPLQPIGNFAGSFDSARDDVETLELAEPGIREIISWAIRGPARRVHFAVRLHRYRASLGFAAAVSQVANQFLTCVELRARRLVAIEIAHKTDAERDVVQI